MSKELFAEYEALKHTIANAEARIDEIKPLVIKLVPEGKEVEGSYGKFHVEPRETWKYSKKLQEDEADLKKRKEGEKAKGIATAVYTPVLYYNRNKE